MNEQPLVSVVMPVFDGARHVAEAIECVLAQNYRPLELIVVDDGSTDDSAAIVRRYGSPVRLTAQAHEGCGSARNQGATLASGEYLAFCDADDRLPTDRLRRQLAVLECDSSIDAVFGDIEEFVSPDLDERVTSLLRAPIARRSVRMMITMLLRTDSFWRVGPFATDLGRALELDWLARADDLGLRIEPCNGVVTHRRLHDGSTGFRRRGDERDYVRAARSAIARRRQRS
jgi:glycosyltransferase involved in cell wall biosynthesis